MIHQFQLGMSPGQQNGYRVSSSSMEGATLTPKKQKCVCCDTWRNSQTGIMKKKGFVCHSCSRGVK
jgi:hypothetical protein